tara:strand:- start:197 stop:337 length:141 start_codon:yes stop_codon:yes gene_type:complete
MAQNDKLSVNKNVIFVVINEKNKLEQIAVLQYAKHCARYRPTIDNL